MSVTMPDIICAYHHQKMIPWHLSPGYVCENCYLEIDSLRSVETALKAEVEDLKTRITPCKDLKHHEHINRVEAERDRLAKDAEMLQEAVNARIAERDEMATTAIRYREALEKIAQYPEDHEGSPEPCSCHYCIADIAKAVLAEEEGTSEG